MTTKSGLEIREILPSEYQPLGQLMIEVYSKLDGFPSQQQLPGYYKMLAAVGSFNDKKDC